MAGAIALALAGCSTQPPTNLALDPSQPGVVAPSPTPATATPTQQPDPTQLAQVLAAVPRAGIGSSGLLVLAEDGTVLAGRGADKALAPASTMKVLTTLAAVDTLGADHRFTTRVVSPKPGSLILVGGGDPLLTDKTSSAAAKPASLQQLAAATAQALAASGTTKVTLGYDASIFTGAGFNSHWKPSMRSYTARVSGLIADAGVVNQWQAQTDPARSAAQAFAARLKRAGLKVRLVGTQHADAAASPIASVESAPLSVVVGRTLRLSDNLAADTLARHVAIASGEKASFSGAATALRAWLVEHQLWSDGMRVLDGSGLSRDARVTPAVLARAVQASASNPGWQAVVTGFPVAGKSGTLKDRFDDKSEKIARGNVQAKTGTLIGVAGLTGQLTTADGARLTFALLANGTSGQNTAYNWLDRSAAAMVRCGCS